MHTLKFSYFSWTTKLALLEFPSGRQLTLAKSQYANFDDIAHILQARIKNSQLKFKFVNRLTIFVIVSSVLIFLMVIQLGKG
ncbi:MAG TPA: hypothetical protein VGK59_04310 [Ohtaekwangia sp.]